MMPSIKLSLKYLSQKPKTVNHSKPCVGGWISDAYKYVRFSIFSIPVYLMVVMLFAEKSLCMFIK